jgi:hypothetical protein
MDDREEYKEPEGNAALGNPLVLFYFNSKCFLLIRTWICTTL